MKRVAWTTDPLRMAARVPLRARHSGAVALQHVIQHDLVQRQAAPLSARRSPSTPLCTC
ncbi:hypothetical protein [Comamonas serinivorans]|uniref:hypothetical protein n=1 Tax=Comamonas serinivorans TaxID=1082851 RepID=UPI0012F98401|nr:hypothetical protein [Comamonas serinivorans]